MSTFKNHSELSHTLLAICLLGISLFSPLSRTLGSFIVYLYLLCILLFLYGPSLSLTYFQSFYRCASICYWCSLSNNHSFYMVADIYGWWSWAFRTIMEWSSYVQCRREIWFDRLDIISMQCRRQIEFSKLQLSI